MFNFSNWKRQIRKGYLELLILKMIQGKKKLYGFEMLSLFRDQGFEVKEGTLYPLLNRLSQEGLLRTEWKVDGSKGHPRKFYLLSDLGVKELDKMLEEFNQLNTTLYDTLDGEKKWKKKS